MDPLEQAEAKIKENDFKSAVELLTQALRIKSDGWTFYRRGYSFYRLQAFDDSIADMTKALESHELSSIYEEMAYMIRGFSYARQKKLQLAIADAISILNSTVHGEGESFDEGCDVIDSVIEQMRGAEVTKADQIALRNALEHVISDIFSPGANGLIWAETHLKWLSTLDV